MSEKFRMTVQELSITYPQCSVTPAEMIKHVRLKWNDSISYILAGQEDHKDGGKHLHIHVQFKKRKDIVNSRIIDHGTFHPNIQKVRYSKEWNEYCKKDGVFQEEGEFRIITENKESKKKQKITNKQLLEGDLKTMIINDEISLYSLPALLNCRKLYKELTDNDKPRETVMLPSIWRDLPLPVFKHKQRHYWLFSRQPNKGKTTFLMKLQEMYSTYMWNTSEKYQSPHPSVQFILFDEYKPGVNLLPVTKINQLCDGTLQIARKGRDSLIITDAIVIICSNLAPNQVYNDQLALDTLYARFNCFDLSNLTFI